VLPVDTQRIHFVGSSCGGYAVLRLAELVPFLPASVVPLAGYYPQMVTEDHDVAQMVARIQSVPKVWPLYCDQDRLCRLESPFVYRLLAELFEQRGEKGNKVDRNIARGSASNFHSASNVVLAHPESFFGELAGFVRRDNVGGSAYLRQRVQDLLSQPVHPACAQPAWAHQAQLALAAAAAKSPASAHAPAAPWPSAYAPAAHWQAPGAPAPSAQVYRLPSPSPPHPPKVEEC